MAEDYDYDGLNRLDKLTAKLGQQVLFEQDYTLLPDGQRDYVIERRWDAASSTFSVAKIDWEYDALNRLTEEVRDEGNDGPGPGDYRHVFSYDLAGNRIRKTTDNGNDGSIDQVTAYRYNARDQLLDEGPDANADGLPDPATELTYAYDANGNTTAKGSDTYTWDLRGRMSSATVNGTVTGYAYDHQGQRISFTAASGLTTYLLNDGNNPTGYPQIIEERQGTSPQSATLSRSYMAGLRMEGQFDAQGVAFFLRDGHGSNRALLDDGGNVIAAFDYQVFGDAIGFDPATAGTTQLFGGDAEFDVSSGNYYHDKRWRRDFAFLSFDDYESSDPRGLHKYLYASSNPVYYTDPTGMFFSYAELKFVTLNITFRAAMALPTVLFYYEAFDLMLTLALLGIDSIPDSYVNPQAGSNAPVQYGEVSTWSDLNRRARLNNQEGTFNFHHTPQKAEAAKLGGPLSGYQPPPSPDEPCIAIYSKEHPAISRAQAKNALDRFARLPKEMQTADDLVVRDMSHLRQHTRVTTQHLKNLAGMIRGKYPSIFGRLRGRR